MGVTSGETGSHNIHHKRRDSPHAASTCACGRNRDTVSRPWHRVRTPSPIARLISALPPKAQESPEMMGVVPTATQCHCPAESGKRCYRTLIAKCRSSAVSDTWNLGLRNGTLYFLVSLGCRSLCWDEGKCPAVPGGTCLCCVCGAPSHHEHRVSCGIRTSPPSRAPPVVHWNSSPQSRACVHACAPALSTAAHSPKSAPARRCTAATRQQNRPIVVTSCYPSEQPASHPSFLRFLPGSFHLFLSLFHPNTQPPYRNRLVSQLSHSPCVRSPVLYHRTAAKSTLPSLQPVESESFS